MDPFNLILFGLLGVLVFFMFRNSRKRRADMEALQAKIVPGAEIMTNFGLYGTLVSIDEDSNVAVVETSPGSTIRVHRQTIARVVDDEAVTTDDDVDDELAERDGVDDAAEPEFGERDTRRDPEKPVD